MPEITGISKNLALKIVFYHIKGTQLPANRVKKERLAVLSKNYTPDS